MTHNMPSKKQLSNWMKQYVASQDEELSSEKQAEVKRLMEFFEQHGITFEKFDPKRFSVLNSNAYPNYDVSQYVPGQHDTNKWLMTVKNIHYKQKGGIPYKEAIQESTQGWKHMEIYDFLNWLKYYEEGAHMKYKFAQNWYVNDSMSGYFVPMNKVDELKPDQAADVQAISELEEKKQIIAQQRKKILSRLDSIRKTLRSQDGHTFAGDELETLLEAIHTLEKKISTLNKLSTSVRIYEDLIVREANVLYRHGFNKAADMLYAVAQTPAAAGQSATGATSGGIDIPPPAAPADPSGAGQRGTSGGINESPGTPNAQSPAGGPETTPESKGEMIPQETQPVGIQQFIEAMNGQEGKSLEQDELAVDDPEEELMVSEAQAVTNMPAAVTEDIPMTTDPAPERGKPAELPQEAYVPEAPKVAPVQAPMPAIEEPLEVTEADIPVGPPKEGEVEVERPASDIESKIDKVMAEATIEDIVAELEDLAKIYKVREISRRLSRVDEMLTAKGLGAVFAVTLSEIQNRNFDSGNYISTRLEDMLSKLRGSLPTNDVDLTGRENEASPDAAAIKAKLEQDQAKEKERKQFRKQQENAELEAPQKAVPQVDMEELTPPAAPQTPVAPQKPAAV